MKKFVNNVVKGKQRIQSLCAKMF